MTFPPAAAVTVGLVALSGVVIRRTFQASDVVVGAVENATVDIVETIAQETTRYTDCDRR